MLEIFYSVIALKSLIFISSEYLCPKELSFWGMFVIWKHVFWICYKQSVSVDCFKSGHVCVCLVSAENLEKSLRQMEKHLLQLEKDLDTFSSADDPQDLFLSKMAISFHMFAYTQYFFFFTFLSKHFSSLLLCYQHCSCFCAW